MIVYEIGGWRKRNLVVAAFYFTAVEDSYAGKTNRLDNVDVIGIAAFREYQEPVSALAQEMFSNAAPATASVSIPNHNRLISSGRALLRM